MFYKTGVIGLDGLLYVVGGNNGQASVEVYDP